MNLSKQAHNEFVEMLKTRRCVKGRESMKTETPIGRGGTQELMDAGLVEYQKDDGLFTTYLLTMKGYLLAVELANEVKPVVKKATFVGKWNGRSGRSVTYHLDGKRDGLRIDVHGFDDESTVKVRLIKGDGRRAGFKMLCEESAPIHLAEKVVARMQLRTSAL